jgi:hypothetical protein
VIYIAVILTIAAALIAAGWVAALVGSGWPTTPDGQFGCSMLALIVIVLTAFAAVSWAVAL